MGVKMNFRIITKNHEADSKIGSPSKINFRADGTQESHPTAWELRLNLYFEYIFKFLDNAFFVSSKRFK